MHSADLVQALINKEGSPWGEITHGRPLTQDKLGKLLRDFGIYPEQIKINGMNRRGYQRTAFEKAFAAYLPAQASGLSSQGATAATAFGIQVNSTFQGATPVSAGSTLESEKYKQHQDGSTGSTLREGVGGNGRDKHLLELCAFCRQPGTSESPLSQREWQGRAILLHAGECGLHWCAYGGPR